MDFPKLLSLECLRARFSNKITSSEIKEVGEELYLLFELNDPKLNQVKPYKIRLSTLLWDKFDYVYESIISADLIRQGYMIVPIEGGWICVSPKGKEYHLEETSCSCGDFLLNKKKGSRCKHLIFKDWTLVHRARINAYRTKL